MVWTMGSPLFRFGLHRAQHGVAEGLIFVCLSPDPWIARLIAARAVGAIESRRGGWGPRPRREKAFGNEP